MRRTIYVGGFAALLVTAAMVLAQPDFQSIISGKNADPITATLETVFGKGGAKVIIVVVLISFLSCVLSLQAAASRLIYSYARDSMVFASGPLSRFSDRLHVPPVALTVAATVPAVIVLIAEVISDNALARVIAFASVGIYIAFQMVVLAALIARRKGWVPSGKYSLGKWGLPVNIAALTYGVLGIVNLAWPRGTAFADRWSVLLGCALIIGVGLLYMLLRRPYLRSDAAHGDATGRKAVATGD